ncbi:HET-domain-containing protein [Karstenula rhodostoma CBS 690.94]|uniref:HET-domain-containing protein n=1 Tax=Karstenula rhodostoma CBS 690.94 TaxID=1392251 RepID=A0A9P4PXA0_9PLEO|nr:HET-domain-containing protein [Karstenula rhodostoma CBS 690.94]
MSPESIDLKHTTASDRSLTQAQAWVEACVSKHVNCERGYSNPRYLPIRLIHIGTDGDIWRLCEYPQLVGDTLPPPRYVTLSYMWGQHQQLLLLKSNIAQFRRGLPISTTLPNTFRDFVCVARRLSVEYLWIDALCIIQDSPQDWTTESMRMRSVYANAYCTIAASWGTDPTKGIFSERKVDDIRCSIIQIAWQDRQSTDLSSCRLVEKDGWAHILEGSPLDHRGWALQERFVSPRILYFTKEQILFECDTHVQCEAFEDDLPQDYADAMERRHRIFTWLDQAKEGTVQSEVRANHNVSPKFFKGWIVIVEQYSRCNLTKRSDRLIAVRGLVELFEHLSGDEYLCGLWRSCIWSSLLWYVDGPSSDTNYDIAPSFSWAAIDGYISLAPRELNLNIFTPFALIDATPQFLILCDFAPLYDPYNAIPLDELLEDTNCNHSMYTDLEGGDGIIVRPTSGLEGEHCLQCLRVGYSSYEYGALSDRSLAAFGLYADQDGNIKEQDGLKKVDFVLK